MPKKILRGFTLIELLVVVAIIGTLSTIGVVAYSKYTKIAQIRAIKAQNNEIYNFIKNPVSLETTFLTRLSKKICHILELTRMTTAIVICFPIKTSSQG